MRDSRGWSVEMTEQGYMRFIDDVAQLGMEITDVRTGIYDASHELAKGNTQENIQAAAVQLKVASDMLRDLSWKALCLELRAKYSGEEEGHE